MKKLTLLILLLCTSISLFAIKVNVAAGYQEKYTGYHQHDPLFVELNIWQDLGDFQVYANYKNEMTKVLDKLLFWPTQDYYKVGAKYQAEWFAIELEHMCYHPVVCWNLDNGVNGGYTEFKITIGEKQ